MVQKQQNWAKSLTMAVNLATNVAAVIAIGGYGGWWLDQKLNTGNNLYTILGGALGVATAFKIMWDKLMEQDRKKKAVEKADQDRR
ncbi:MAG: AtpZ/AtpI family protein [Syntrophomonadaceae bacterium]|nr:AtpZ/AtpI family protein [Syntrophomonadaceae bacterium]